PQILYLLQLVFKNRDRSRIPAILAHERSPFFAQNYSVVLTTRAASIISKENLKIKSPSERKKYYCISVSRKSEALPSTTNVLKTPMQFGNFSLVIVFFRACKEASSPRSALFIINAIGTWRKTFRQNLDT